MLFGLNVGTLNKAKGALVGLAVGLDVGGPEGAWEGELDGAEVGELVGFTAIRCTSLTCPPIN